MSIRLWTEKQEIRTIIAFLKKSGNLTIKSTNKYSVITIINWHRYQCKGSDDQPSDQPTANQQLTTYKNEKNIKNKISPEEILSAISALMERYPDRETTNQTFQAISSTRKSKRIADSVKLSIVQSLGTVGLLKNVHLRRCAANIIAQRISIYASLFGFCAPCSSPFLNSPRKIGFFNRPTVPG